jgi:hypothetical protein
MDIDMKISKVTHAHLTFLMASDGIMQRQRQTKFHVIWPSRSTLKEVTTQSQLNAT